VTLVTLLLVPVLALVGLWAFLASITLGNAITQRQFNSEIRPSGSAASNGLLNAVGQERAATFLWLSNPQRPPVSQLAAARQADDAAITTYRASTSHNLSGDTATELFTRRGMQAELAAIPGIRAAVDAGRLSAAAAFAAYDQVIEALFTTYVSVNNPDVTGYRDTLAAIYLARALEQVAREMTLAGGAALSHEAMSQADHDLFASAVYDQNQLIADATALSSGPLRTSLVQLYGSPAHRQFAALESQISGSTSHLQLLAALPAWEPAAKAFLGQLVTISQAQGDLLAGQATRTSDRLILEAGLAGGLGLLAVAASVFLLLRFARRIRRELTSLHDGAAAMAHERLPRVIERLRGGEDVDVAAESPPLPGGRIAEVARVADAFSAVQRTAVDAAVSQANLRKGVNQVFLNLSLRNQSLLHRQLGMLDTMERATNEPDALADLFRLDHLTTRMRRHAESLIILSGATPGRGWREPVPVLDVLRAAIAEVENYTRVDVASESAEAITGPAVNDVIHLLAELVENATTFSPPNTRVEIRADAVGTGFAVEIEDRGLGLKANELAQVNARLARPPEFDLAHSNQLGLFVVGQLAARHGIRVSLRESPYGGTTAIVILPRSLTTRDGDTAPPDTGSPRQPASAGMNGTSRPEPSEDPVAQRERASAFTLTGRHRFDALRPGSRAQPAGAPGAPESEAGAMTSGELTWPGGKGSPGQPAGPPAGPTRPEPARARPPWETPPSSPPDRETAPPGSLGQSPRLVPGGTHRGLPRRLRQTSLAPQLRGQPSAASPAPPPAERSPEDMRSLLSALQDGWQRGRAGEGGSPMPGSGPGGHRSHPGGWPDGEPGPGGSESESR
jgi:signal transduction histidine kinase